MQHFAHRSFLDPTLKNVNAVVILQICEDTLRIGAS